MEAPPARDSPPRLIVSSTCARESFDATAQRIRNDRIAVLLDTSGFVVHARPEILALRPAPIQINCIGFAGTLGADFYDYILTDRFVSPPGQQVNFVERFMYLPHCYLPGDARRAIGRAPSRADCAPCSGTGFVFCRFNTSYKIRTSGVRGPDASAATSRPSSVLWLLEHERGRGPQSPARGGTQGIAAQRLIFAPRVPLADRTSRGTAAADLPRSAPCRTTLTRPPTTRCSPDCPS